MIAMDRGIIIFYGSRARAQVLGSHNCTVKGFFGQLQTLTGVRAPTIILPYALLHFAASLIYRYRQTSLSCTAQTCLLPTNLPPRLPAATPDLADDWSARAGFRARPTPRSTPSAPRWARSSGLRPGRGRACHFLSDFDAGHSQSCLPVYHRQPPRRGGRIELPSLFG